MNRVFQISVLVTLCLVTSCAKDKNNDNKPDEIITNYRLSSIVYDDGRMINYYFNEKGQLRKISKSNGSYEEFIYDNDNKLVLIKEPNDEVGFLYDGSRLVQVGGYFLEYNSQNIPIKLVSGDSNTSYNLNYDNQGRLVTKVRIEDNIQSPVYDSTIYKWSSDGNLTEKKEVNKHWYSIANDYRRYLDQENYEYDSFLNPFNTIQLPESYKVYRMIAMNDLDESFSKNNVVEIRKTHKEEYENLGGNNQTSTITRLFNVSDSENNLPKRIVGEFNWNSYNLLYDKLQ